MAVYVKENTISLFLLSISDLVNKEITTNLNPITPNFTKLITNTNVDVNNSFEILRRESELFSFNPMPTKEMAEELYKDLEPLQTRSDEYVIHHDIVFKASDNSFYKFNIEKENEKNTSIFQDPEESVTGFYIQSIQIKNAPKDIFTTRANYTVTIKILFNFFDDLLKDQIDVYPIGTDLSDPLSAVAANLGLTKIALIKILYKKYFSNALGVINNAQDKEGIYLVQRMQFKNNSINFNETAREFEIDQVGRTFHLISKQHEFNICKSNEPAFSAFDNELTITYVASEVEELPEKGKSLAEIETKNLFDLLDDQSLPNSLATLAYNGGYFGGSSTVNNLYSNLSTYKNKISELQQWQDFIKDRINCFNLASKFEKTDPNKSAGYLSKAQASPTTGGTPLKLEDLQNSLTANKEKIDAVIFELNRALMFKILLECEIYELQNIDNSLLNTFEQNFNFLQYFKNLDAGRAFGLAGQIAVGAVGAIAFAPEGAAIAATAAKGAALYGGLALLPEVGALVSEINKEPLISSDIDIPKIRSALSNSLKVARITTNSGNQQQSIQAIFPKLKTSQYSVSVKGNNTGTNSDAFEAGSVLLSTGRDARGKEKEIKKEIEESLSIVAPEADNATVISGSSNIRFIRFSDIIKIYKKLNTDVKIISGGKIILQDITGGNPSFIYLNNADYLISLEAFSNFLYKNIMLKDRKFLYDSEEFLRDAFQTLLGKDLLSGNDSISTEIKKIAPTNLRFNTSINIDGDLSELIGGAFDILNNSRFITLKKQIFKTRNIAGRLYNGSSPKFVKLLFLGSDQDIKYYDFYQKYNEWLLTQPASLPTQLSSTTFQRYMNTEHLIPCIPVRNSATTETILKSKNITFSRIDNKNAESGVIIADETVRLPYQIKAKLQPYLSLFLGASNYIFVAPPESSSPNTRNIFGFGGLYIIKQTTYEWNFVNAAGANPAYSSYLDIDGYHVSYGDGIKILPPKPSGSPPTLCE